MRETKKAICYLLLMLTLALPAALRDVQAQGRDQDEPIRLKADLVTITAAVTDRNGRAIKSLKAEDFTVYEDGVRQKITHFAATEEPFTLMLLLDISGSTRDDIALIRRAAKNFLAELRSDDRVGVMVFSRNIVPIAELDDSRARAEAAIEQIATPEGAEGYRFTSNTGTSFYDALYMAVEQSPLKNIEGRKAIVCMSDGVDSTSKSSFNSVGKLVERAEAPVYFLHLNTEEATLAGLLKSRSDPDYLNFSQSQINRYYDEYAPDSMERYRPRDTMAPGVRREINTGLYEIARRELRAMAEHTGGRVYPVRSLFDLAGVYKQVADDLRSQYSLGYYSANETHDGRWRSTRVDVRSPGATVRARSGYWAPGK